MQKPSPVLVADRFHELLDALLELLEGLDKTDWDRPTVATGWTVKDVALHMLGGDIGNLSRRRDHFRLPSPELSTWDDLVGWLNSYNQQWVDAGKRIGPRVLCDLLRLVGDQLCAYFLTLDPFALGAPVSWVGPQAAPVWLDVAREFTERWHHQQHIRDAVDRPGLTEPRYLGPVLATLVHGLPRGLASTRAPEGTSATLVIRGPAGGDWTARFEKSHWILYEGRPPEPEAAVELDQDLAWRLFTKGMSAQAALDRVQQRGEPGLSHALLATVSIIA